MGIGHDKFIVVSTEVLLKLPFMKGYTKNYR